MEFLCDIFSRNSDRILLTDKFRWFILNLFYVFIFIRLSDLTTAEFIDSLYTRLVLCFIPIVLSLAFSI